MVTTWLSTGAGNLQARTHALVIGVSHYAHLPATPGARRSDAQETFGLGQIDVGASSAYAFACWLKNEYRSVDAPLGTVRLLLSPSQVENDANPKLGALDETTAPRASSAAVQSALNEWQAECRQDPAGVAMFFVAGHGIQFAGTSILLLEDFAQPGEQVLKHALDVDSVRHGLGGPQACQRQWFFVDSCKVDPDAAGNYLSAAVGVTLDRLRGPEPPNVVTASAAIGGTAGWGVAGEGTLFSTALLECLRGRAVEFPRDEIDNYHVRTSSLVNVLQNRVDELAKEHHVDQTARFGDAAETVLHVFPEPPKAEVVINVIPAEMAAIALIDVRCTISNALVANGEQPPLRLSNICSGPYQVSARAVHDDPAPFQPIYKQLEVRPPKTESPIRVKTP
jgi:Caspase domain.